MSFEEIAVMNQEALRKQVREKMLVTAFNDLMKEKDGLKKMAALKYEELELQPYFSDPNLTIKQKQLLFKWRTKMIKVGWNYGTKTQCPLCHLADDTQEHLLNCSYLYPDSTTINSDIDQNNLKLLLKNLEEAIRKRETALEELAKKESTMRSTLKD